MIIKGGGTGKTPFIPIFFICTTCTPSSPEFRAIAGITPHHFETDTGDFLQRLPEGLQPFLLPLGILLGANHIDVMRYVVSSVITGPPLPLGEEPGGDLLWGWGCTFY